MDLLCRLPKPFYFNYFSLTFFPGVDLTERALQDGHIRRDDVEDVAQKGYHLWGGSLTQERATDKLRWDVAYTFAVHDVPRRVIHRLLDSPAYTTHIHRFARLARGMHATARWKDRMSDRITGKPNAFQLIVDNTNRDRIAARDLTIQPNIDSAPFSQAV